ncbi:FecR family protein [Novosphingobium decolorationis]|uniref:FecR domain-containing protein n=1 Tax=Novosphingobium decolorationis TaxID=2698673 RepID=A0ABX8EBU9_9SPHN|nr:FecR domain-containing protein [Novosphingobium decolorationis]QVM85625.1 FecR domain-containing protein [Novosphingobium decolorationis]
MPIDETIRAQALDWAVRTQDPGFDHWESFTIWLEQDPAHGVAYDAACAAALDGADLLARTAPANDTEPAIASPDEAEGNAAWVEDTLESYARVPRRRWLAGALAASVALVAGIGIWHQSGPTTYEVATAVGETRTVRLGGETTVTLGGDTRLAMEQGNARFVRLEQGQALFSVRHDPDAPFEVAVGEERLRDIGTVFDVRHVDGALRVAVSEGEVEVNPEREKVRVKPGQVLTRAAGEDRFELAAIAPEQVGEWRAGRLTFVDAPLGEVASDLTRATGIAFSVRPEARGRTVSGSLQIEPIRKDPQSLGALLGLGVAREGAGWSLGPR